MPIIQANIGYLPAIVYKELLAGRTVDITGGLLMRLTSLDEYQERKPRLHGKFGEVISWTPGGTKALIATRPPPQWAEQKIHETIWECESMQRWPVPEEYR